MSRLKLFIVLGFGLMFIAGLEVGRAHTSVSSLKEDWRRLSSTITGTTPNPPATQAAKSDMPHKLFGEIDISPSQDEQIHKIFHDARAHTDSLSRQFHDIDRQHDEQIVAMLDPIQKIEYEAIEQQRDAQVGDLRAKISAIMEKAGTDVRALLTPEQQVKFDAAQKRFAEGRDRDHGRHGGPGGGSWRGGPPGHRPHAATSQSTSPEPAATQP